MGGADDGAVNTVVLDGGRRSGHNTDWWGFAEGFRRGLPDADLSSAVQLGAGGAGVATAYAALSFGLQRLIGFDREGGRAQALARLLSPLFPNGQVAAGTDLAAEMKRTAGHIHTTPTGMVKYPGLPLDAELLSPEHCRYRLFPLETMLLKEARQRGCRKARRRRHGSVSGSRRLSAVCRSRTGCGTDARAFQGDGRLITDNGSLIKRAQGASSNRVTETFSPTVRRSALTQVSLAFLPRRPSNGSINEHEGQRAVVMGLSFWLSAAAFAIKFSIDEHFLGLLRKGDQKAMSELIARHHGALVRLAESVVKNRAVAEEVAQETWLAVMANLASFEGRSTLSTWIISILLNKAKNHAKRESRYAAFGDGDDPERDLGQTMRNRFDGSGHWSEAPVSFDGLTPERIVAGRHLWEHVRQMIDRLPPAQKAVLVMRDVEGADAAETCRLLELTPENQRTLLHRARTRIRNEIETQLTGGRSALTKA